MQKELTISLSDETYNGLMNLVGEQNASQFIESVLHPYILLVETNKTFKIHSPRLVDRSQIDRFKMELIEDNKK